MLQCKRFHWEDEFNEWARKENISSHQIVAIESLPPDSFMVFYDKNLSNKSNFTCYDNGNGNGNGNNWATVTLNTATNNNIKGV